ncbi:IPTL-CTERM sorting domain-containing protein [Ottowia thiooxydans]|uniref:IPTL-CTERM sorting domain-containing protein n=1 Tax=Ottowia thiooxydans TaxID=219182 RepID=UPI0009FDEBA5|nr:IPTL-CTERM sorting domain-containing protein [Ottowia thiooxydans]
MYASMSRILRNPSYLAIAALLLFGGTTQVKAQSTIIICEDSQIVNIFNEACTSITDSSFLTGTPDVGSALVGTASTPIANVISNDTIFRGPDDFDDGNKYDAANLNELILTVLTPATHSGVVLNTVTGAVTTTATVPAGTYVISYNLCFSKQFTIDAETGFHLDQVPSTICSSPTSATVTVAAVAPTNGGVHNVPSLSEYGLMILSSALLFFGFPLIRRRSK